LPLSLLHLHSSCKIQELQELMGATKQSRDSKGVLTSSFAVCRDLSHAAAWSGRIVFTSSSAAQPASFSLDDIQHKSG
jgi:hypothetical protein